MEEDLIAITNRAISIAKSPKLDKYEFEADEMALRYMARSGYDLGGLAGLLTKLKSRHDREVDMFDLNYRNHPDFKKRMDLSAKKLKKYKRYTGRKFAENFNENMVF